MGHNCVRAKVRRRKVAALAAYSRQFTVSNTTKNISPVVEHKRYEPVYNNPIVNPLTGNKFDQVNPHPIPGRFGITVTGYDWIKPEGLLWKKEHHKQPKRIIKYKKRKYSNWKSYAPQPEEVKKVKSDKRNDFLKYFRNYPYTIKPMSKEAYMEKLTQHKLEKWERKNPCPEAMFVEDVEKWKQERFVIEQRLRDFVVSIYDKLSIMGNRVDAKNSKMKADKIAEIKDIDGKGHDVTHPNLSTEDKLYKEASKKAQDAMNKDETILDADLVNHKHNQKRPLNAKRAKTVTLADKKVKKAA